MVPPTTATADPLQSSTQAVGTPDAPAIKAPVRDTILTPRFYTTDFDAMAAMDLRLNEDELEAICEEFRKDLQPSSFRPSGRV